MTRGEIRAFIASLHVISNEIGKIVDPIPWKIQVELSAMENVLRRELDDQLRVNKG